MLPYLKQHRPPLQPGTSTAPPLKWNPKKPSTDVISTLELWRQGIAADATSMNVPLLNTGRALLPSQTHTIADPDNKLYVSITPIREALGPDDFYQEDHSQEALRLRGALLSGGLHVVFADQTPTGKCADIFYVNREGHPVQRDEV
jgi:hypothetical protein